MTATRLRVLGLRAEVGGARLLDDVDLAAEAGEIVVVAGPSGAGKTTLLRALLGVPPPGGRLAWRAFEGAARDGAPWTSAGPDDGAWPSRRRTWASLVSQAPAAALDPLRPLGDELARIVGRRAEKPASRDVAARAALVRAGLSDDAAWLRARPHQLSGGEAERAALALSWAAEPSLLLLDEPTAALDPIVASDLLRGLRRAADERGLAAVVVTHDARVAAAVADRVVVIARGRVVEEATPEDLFARPRSEAARGFVAAATAEDDGPASRGAVVVPEGPALLAMHDVRKSYRARGAGLGLGPRREALASATLEVGAGDVVAVVGASGSGKSTLARLAAGVEEPDAGEVLFGGASLAGLGAAGRRRLRGRLRLAWQDAYAALDPRLPSGDAVAEALVAGGIRDRAALAREVAALCLRFGLDPAAAARPPHELSGGERQRIGLAAAAARDPEMVVADEAPAALDVPSRRAAFSRLLRRDDGSPRTVLFVSHDLPLVRATARRVVVLDGGRVVEEGPTAEVLRRPSHPATARLLAAELPARPDGRAAWFRAAGPAPSRGETGC